MYNSLYILSFTRGNCLYWNDSVIVDENRTYCFDIISCWWPCLAVPCITVKRGIWCWFWISGNLEAPFVVMSSIKKLYHICHWLYASKDIFSFCFHLVLPWKRADVWSWHLITVRRWRGCKIHGLVPSSRSNQANPICMCSQLWGTDPRNSKVK